MSEFIPLSVPSLRGNEWKYVKECLDGEWVSSAGPFVDRFEKEFAQYVGARHAVACASGTAALHVSLLLAGVQPGDEVLVPTLTFIASVNVIRYCGAHPVFFDADDFYNLQSPQVETFLRGCEQTAQGLRNPKTGRRVAALLPVHVFGNAVDLVALERLCAQLGLPIVEDAAESLGSRYQGRHGNRHTGTVGRLGAFSFNGNKIITTGGGGMIVTDDEALAKKARYLTTQAKDDEVRFVHDEVGFNYRMTNVQAAMGVAQLEQLERHKARKKEIFQQYGSALAEVRGLRLASVPDFADNNHWMFGLQVGPEYGEDREILMARLQRVGIQTRPVWVPNHRQKPFLDCERMEMSGAEGLWQCTLNIPCSSGLTNAQVDRVIRELRRE